MVIGSGRNFLYGEKMKQSDREPFCLLVSSASQQTLQLLFATGFFLLEWVPYSVPLGK